MARRTRGALLIRVCKGLRRNCGRREAVWLRRMSGCSMTTNHRGMGNNEECGLTTLFCPSQWASVGFETSQRNAAGLDGSEAWGPGVRCWRSRSDFLLTCAGCGARRWRTCGLHRGALFFWGATTVRSDGRRLVSRLGCPPHMIKIGLTARRSEVSSRRSGRLRCVAPAAFLRGHDADVFDCPRREPW